MTRTLAIAGLILLAAFLPLAVPLIAIVLVIEAPNVVAGLRPVVLAGAQPISLLAVTSFRGPPSR